MFQQDALVTFPSFSKVFYEFFRHFRLFLSPYFVKISANFAFPSFPSFPTFPSFSVALFPYFPYFPYFSYFSKISVFSVFSYFRILVMSFQPSLRTRIPVKEQIVLAALNFTIVILHCWRRRNSFFEK